MLRRTTHLRDCRAGILVGLAVSALSGCGPSPQVPVSVQQSALVEPSSATATGRPVDRSPRPGSPRLVALGDSLTAGLGLAADEAYPALLETRLAAAGHDLEVVNAGVSGDTTAGGLRRLEWALDGNVEYLIVALGGNDGLRGLPVEQMKRNLTEIIGTAQARGAKVLLAGMEAPPNFGQVYTEEFRDVYRQLAREHDIIFVPFLLEGVAGVEALNQSDGIHPNPAGAARVAAHLWPAVEALVGQAAVDAGQ